MPEKEERSMAELKERMAKLRSETDPTNPFIPCLAELLNPPTKQYLATLIQSYERLPAFTGRKKLVVSNLISDLKKKYRGL